MDILQPLAIDKWNLLRDALKRDWPTYAYYYYLINNSIKWKNKDPQLELQFFCPHGDVNVGTFVGISTQSRRIVYTFAFKESKNLLLRVLKETTVINWKKFHIFPAVHSHFNDVIADFIYDHADDKNITVRKVVMYNYIKPRDECLLFEITVPKECDLRYLDETHIPLVHSLWPRRSKRAPEKTMEYLASMVRLNRGIGLFLKDDGSLVSWILHTDWGGLGSLQTVEEHKRKGYAKIVVKAMAKKLAEEENLDSFAFAADKNVFSQNLFESLGYKRLESASYYSTLSQARIMNRT